MNDQQKQMQHFMRIIGQAYKDSGFSVVNYADDMLILLAGMLGGSYNGPIEDREKIA